MYTLTIELQYEKWGLKKQFLRIAKAQKTIKTADLVKKELKISRQTLAAHLSALVRKGQLPRKSGSTRSATYTYPTKKVRPPRPKTLALTKKTPEA